MTTTTADAIRDRAITVITALVPRSLSHDRFKAYLNEGDADFTTWAESTDAGAFRRFQVRDTGSDQPPDVSNTDVEARIVSLRVTIAYPQTSRAGAKGGLARDKIMSQDQHQIEHAIGMAGSSNFSSSTNPAYPDACWTSGSTLRRVGRACDYLVIEQAMLFYRSMP